MTLPSESRTVSWKRRLGCFECQFAVSFLRGYLYRLTAPGVGSFPLRRLKHVRPTAREAGFERARARGARPLGARADLRGAPRAEPRRPEVVVHRRPGHREQEARGAHGVGADAQGRLPALQGRAEASTSATRTASTARGSGSRSASSASSGSTRSARSRSTASRSSPRAAARSSSSRPQELTRGSIRLGQWMDWGNDYFTFSDTNIEYIWRFLKIVHERGWLYLGHRATAWCPRCGTSLSQHELTQGGVYQEKSDPSLFVRFPLLDESHEGESVVIWTTTPWTLPANVAAAVHPEGEYGLRENGEWVLAALFPDDTFVERVQGAELVGLRYTGPFDNLPPGRVGRAPGRAVGRGLARGGNRDRPHRDGLRPRGLRARPVARAARADADRRVGPLLRRLRLAPRPVDGRGRPTRSSATSGSAASWSRRARTSTTTRTAGAATRRSSTGSPTTGSSASTRSGRSSSRRTRRSSGCPSTWASAWTTGCATWATGTSRAGATTGCRCRSTRARAGT